MGWESDVLLWIQDNLRNAVLDPICKFFGYIGAHGECAIAVALLLLIIPKTRHIGIVCSVSLATSYILGNIIIKQIVDRPRPYDTIDGLTLLTDPLKDASFPSGHASATFACLLVIVLMMPKIYGIPALFVSLFMSYSRLHVGAHYPTDVIVGIALGISCACFYTVIYKKKFAPDARGSKPLKGK